MSPRTIIVAALVCAAFPACARGIDPYLDDENPVDASTASDAPLPTDAPLRMDVPVGTDVPASECDPGATRACYTGPSGTEGVGACRGGMQTCDSSGTWGTTCNGQVTPRGMETCGNGTDDDCNGMVDDGCGACTPGTTRSCYSGPAGTDGVGACRAGSQTCTSARDWPTICTGEVTPRAEVCGNGMDEDCNGMIDDGCGVCTPGTTRSCYSGPAGTDGVGTCRAGSQTCTAARDWPTICTGEVTPRAEVCGNGMDEDCNGTADNGCISAPANDTCTAATPYTIGSTASGDTSGARNDYSSSCGGSGAGPDVAFSFTSDGSATTYTITSSTTTFDGVLHVHSSSTCSSANEVICNDDAGSTRRSEVQLQNLPQGTYYIVQDGFSSTASGTFTLTSSRASINNDTCTTPAPITANGTYTGSTTGRGANYTGTCGSNTDLGADVVYSLRARTSGSITLTTCGSSFDTVLYVGTTCGSASVACNDDGGGCGVGSSVTFSATAGTTYYIVVDGYNGASGSYQLNVTGY